MQDQSAPTDRLVAAIAARQHGVVALRQLISAGIDKRAVARRLQAGRLHRLHRGVYAVGHPAIGNQGRWMAAVLACGRRAVLSHFSAAALWELLPSGSGLVHVTIAGGGGRHSHAGLIRHRSRTLAEAQVICRRSIPVTTVARTIADLQRTATAAVVRRAIRQAEVMALPLGDVTHDGTRSELERRFLSLCRRYGLPKPAVNVALHGFTVDFAWVDRGLLVETDGYRYHRGAQAFEDDRSRDLQLRTDGFEIVRLTYRQVTGEPARVAKALGMLLSTR